MIGENKTNKKRKTASSYSTTRTKTRNAKGILCGRQAAQSVAEQQHNIVIFDVVVIALLMSHTGTGSLWILRYGMDNGYTVPMVPAVPVRTVLVPVETVSAVFLYLL